MGFLTIAESTGEVASTLATEIIVILFAVGIYLFLMSQKTKRLNFKYIIILLSVFLFQIMAEPMWSDIGLADWAYLYRNVSWIFTIGFASIFMITFYIVDEKIKNRSETVSFFLYLLVLTSISTIIESILFSVGLREYSTTLTQSFSGISLLGLVPIEILLASALVGALVIPLYKYLTE